MRLTRKLVLAASLAAIALMSAAGLASANNLSISSSTFRVAWTPLRFAESGGAGITCNVTLEGSFHSATIAKVDGLLIGNITRVSIAHETCREPIGFFTANAWAYNGTENILGVTPRTTLPWPVTYKGFTGTLPNFEVLKVLLHGLRFATQISAKSCLGTYGSAEENVIGEAVMEQPAHTIRSLRPEANASLALKEGAGCPNPGFFSGEGRTTVAGSTTAITVTLI